MSTGLVRKSSAPASRPLMRLSRSLSPVTRMIGVRTGRGVALQLLTDRVTVGARKRHIEQNHVGIVSGDAGECGLRISGDSDEIALIGEQPTEQAGDAGVVIDDEHPCLVPRRARFVLWVRQTQPYLLQRSVYQLTLERIPWLRGCSTSNSAGSLWRIVSSSSRAARRGLRYGLPAVSLHVHR